jgi:hypothetical protein
MVLLLTTFFINKWNLLTTCKSKKHITYTIEPSQQHIMGFLTGQKNNYYPFRLQL